MFVVHVTDKELNMQTRKMTTEQTNKYFQKKKDQQPCEKIFKHVRNPRNVIKATARFYVTSLILAKKLMSDNVKYNKDIEEAEFLHSTGERIGWKTVQHYLVNMIMPIPYNPVSSSRGINPKEILTPVPKMTFTKLFIAAT